ncbi:MAG: hypothetical protein ACE37F_05810 [Nannocystaceae bacterium]|nr:hypothetical protein [bacterium]
MTTLVGLACAPPGAPAASKPPAAPICPEPVALPDTVVAPADPIEDDVAPADVSLPEGDLEWGIIEPEDLQPRSFDGVSVTVSPYEGERADGSLDLIAQVTVADAVGTLATFEHPVDTGLCGSEVSTNVEVVGLRTASQTLFDAQVTCGVGESHPRWNTSHTVFRVDEVERTATLLVYAQAGSWVVLEESQDVRTLRFFLEADTLAMYEERSAWCDPQAAFEAHGLREPDCRVKPRTLKLRRRIPLP